MSPLRFISWMDIILRSGPLSDPELIHIHEAGRTEGAVEMESDRTPDAIRMRPMDLEADIDELVVAMREAFDDDSRRFRGTSEGGPPGYDNGDFLRMWAPQGEAYTILYEGKIVGNIIVFPQPGSVTFLGNITIHPDFQDKGIGSHVIVLVESKHSDCRVWRLGTPEWAIRNHHFYEKNGYRLVEKTESEDDFITYVFEKNMDEG